MEGESCKNCAYAVLKNGQITCRLHPPTAIPIFVPGKLEGVAPQVQVHFVWPVVAMDDWCGDWAEKDWAENL